MREIVRTAATFKEVMTIKKLMEALELRVELEARGTWDSGDGELIFCSGGRELRLLGRHMEVKADGEWWKAKPWGKGEGYASITGMDVN